MPVVDLTPLANSPGQEIPFCRLTITWDDIQTTKCQVYKKGKRCLTFDAAEPTGRLSLFKFLYEFYMVRLRAKSARILKKAALQDRLHPEWRAIVPENQRGLVRIIQPTYNEKRPLLRSTLIKNAKSYGGYRANQQQHNEKVFTSSSNVLTEKEQQGRGKAADADPGMLASELAVDDGFRS